jgi:hypothetical protein
MSQFVAFSSNVEVSGEVLVSWLEGTEGKIKPYLKAYGLEVVNPGLWYPQQTALNALRDFADSGSLFNAGLLISEIAIFPPTVKDIWTALESLNDAYHMNHRNGDIGSYTLKRRNGRSADIIAETPYPCEFDFGLIYHMAHRWAPKDTEVTVIHDRNEPCRKAGDHTCTYHISW